MRLFNTFLGYLSLTLFSLSATANQGPIPYEAKFQAEWDRGWFPITVEAKRSLKPDSDGRWQLNFEVNSSLADLREHSSLELIDNQLVPQNYVYKTSGLLSKEKREQVFHWDKKKVWGGHEKKFWDYELPVGAQDSLSYQEQLRLDLINNKTELSYPVIYKHKLKTYEFEIIGETQLETPNGKIKTIEVKQRINKYNDLNTRIWFAVDYGYILVKISQKRPKGGGQTITLYEAKVGGKTLKAFTD